MIGIFDSGLGGLTVVKAILKKNPGLDILYFGDTARLPYGTKSKKAVLKYSKENTDFLRKKGAQLIVIACNTSSAIATPVLKKEHRTPLFDVISPTVKIAAQKTKNNKIGIIATPSTIKSGLYQKKLKEISKGTARTYTQPCPLLVPLIEEGWFSGKITKDIVKKYLSSLKKKNIDVLILGCTHYPLIKNIISEEMGKKVEIIDSAEAVAQGINNFIKKEKASFKKQGKLQMFLSDEGYNFARLSKKILGKNISYRIINLK